MGSKGMFARDATGLVREMGTSSAMWLNVLALGITIGPVAGLSYGFYSFPGANFTLACIIMLVLQSAFVLIPYTCLASTMPRSGGDYVFQSRILHPSIGFTFSMGAYFFWTLTAVILTGWGFSSFALSPFLTVYGVATNNPGLVQAAGWLLTNDGVYITSLLILIICFPVVLISMGVYSKVQKWFLMPAIGIGGLIIIFTLLSVNNSTFIANLNTWAQQAGFSGDYYQYIIDTARAQGFNGNPGFSWYATYGMLVIIGSGTSWSFWSSFVGGEIKRAGAIRTRNHHNDLLISSHSMCLGIDGTRCDERYGHGVLYRRYVPGKQ